MMKATEHDVRAWLGEDDPETIKAILATGSDDEAAWVRVVGERDGQDVTGETLDAASRDFVRASETSDAARDALRAAVVAAVREGMSKSEVSRRAGISRPTLDAWLSRVAQNDIGTN